MKPSPLTCTSTCLLALSLLSPLPYIAAQTGAAPTTAGNNASATLFQGEHYTLRLPTGWQNISSKKNPGYTFDTFQKGSTHLNIFWLQDLHTPPDEVLAAQASAPFQKELDDPTTIVTRSMNGLWHGLAVIEGSRITATRRNIPVIISIAICKTSTGRFIIQHATNNEQIPGEEEAIIRSFTPKS